MTKRPALASIVPRTRTTPGNALAAVCGAIALIMALIIPYQAQAADTPSPVCKQLQGKYPQFKGKTLVDAG